MRKQILFPILISLIALPLLSFESVKKDPRLISPEVAALVVVSKPASGNLETSKKTVETIKQDILNKKEAEGGYLDSEVSDNQYASRTFYTIQAGSFIKIADAGNQFDSIMQELNKKNLDYLRIEKVGKYYSVRLGKFENHAATEKFLRAIKPRLSTAIILKAYIKNERIERLYRESI